jgi:L-ascorbate metabolism protein UlaG (beta-lactamase superfamily)
MKELFFHKSKRRKPGSTIPSKKTDLLSLSTDKNILVWFGHSSYFMQVDGKKILVDPVFSGAASPIKATTRSFPGSDIYTTDDIPDIDFLFISHDHWDHLDYETILALKPKIKTIITGLGTATHLERWGYDTNMIYEKDWKETVELGNGFIVHTAPARHFSGRGLKRNQAIWTSFVLLTTHHRIYLGGDSGYDTHFKEIGNMYGPFDLAILECGQYDKNWKYIHMMPEQVLQAAADLQAKKLLPVHWGKFALANHDWDTPIITVTLLNKNIPLLTPMIGEELNLDAEQSFTKWWIGV